MVGGAVPRKDYGKALPAHSIARKDRAVVDQIDEEQTPATASRCHDDLGF
jgi:hypothetical protein